MRASLTKDASSGGSSMSAFEASRIGTTTVWGVVAGASLANSGSSATRTSGPVESSNWRHVVSSLTKASRADRLPSPSSSALIARAATKAHTSS